MWKRYCTLSLESSNGIITSGNSLRILFTSTPSLNFLVHRTFVLHTQCQTGTLYYFIFLSYVQPFQDRLRWTITVFFFLHILENLALNKPTFQKNLAEALVAVDGLKKNDGQCVHSDEREQIATLWINLTRIASIHHITVYYRTGKTKWGTY